MPKLVTSLTINATNKFVLQSPLDVFTATSKENIILGESRLESVADMTMSMIKLTHDKAETARIQITTI